MIIEVPPPRLDGLAEWEDDREVFRDPRMIALVMQQDAQLRELMARQSQDRVRIALEIRKELRT